MTTKSLVTTSESAVLQPVDAAEDWDPEKETKQAYVTAAASTRLKYEDETNNELTSTVVAFGSADFFDAGLMGYDSLLNGEYTVQMFNELAGKEENTLNIVPKTENAETLDITQATVNVVLIIFVILVPIAVFAVGLIIWFKRRHR